MHCHHSEGQAGTGGGGDGSGEFGDTVGVARHAKMGAGGGGLLLGKEGGGGGAADTRGARDVPMATGATAIWSRSGRRSHRWLCSQRRPPTPGLSAHICPTGVWIR